MKVLLLENIHPVAKKNLEAAGVEVDLHSSAMNEDELIANLKNYQAVGIRSKTQVTKKVLEASKHLDSICCFCIGTNQVDLNTAKNLGIPVFNAPYSNTRSVAELVIGEIICLARKVAHVSMLAHQGIWNKSAKTNHEVRGKKLGIVGYGHIGSQVSVLAESMGMDVRYYDIIKKLPLGNSSPIDSLKELMSTCDFVSLHVPETPETKNMITARELSWMKEGSYLINASRGSVVEIDALASFLKEGKLGGAAIDVFPSEPKNNQEKFTSALQGLDNVILTPHIGGSTEEAQENIGAEVSESMNRFLKEGFTGGAVNFPKIECHAPQEGARRIINVHKNVPGVLSEVNKIVSSLGSNIMSQHLDTDNEIGYLVMDVEAGHGPELSEQISQLETSIKTRIL
jgi:D-3-phosphoglycerate dehydrogenase